MINLVISFTLPGISWGGHIGGLIGGALVALILQHGGASPRCGARRMPACIAIAVLAVGGSIATSKSSEVENVGSPPGLVNQPE